MSVAGMFFGGVDVTFGAGEEAWGRIWLGVPAGSAEFAIGGFVTGFTESGEGFLG